MLEILRKSLDDGTLEYRLQEWGKWVVAQSGNPRLRGSSVFADSNNLLISDDEAGLIDNAVRKLKTANPQMGEAICFMYIPRYNKPNVRLLGDEMSIPKTRAFELLRDSITWLHAYLFATLEEEKKRYCFVRTKTL